MTVRPRQVWGAGVLVACLALLGIVAVVAEGRPLEGPSSSAQLDVAGWWRDVLTVAFLLVLVGGLVLIIWTILGPRRAPTVMPRRPRRRWWLTALAVAVLFLAATALGPILDEGESADTGPPTVTAEGAAEGDTSPPPPWAVLALAAAGAAALVTAVVVARRLRPDPPDPEAPAATEPLLAALDASLTELEQATDPRSAVIAAYARLLEGFSAAGLARREAETPLEHLRRGLAALSLRPQPAERLTRLFLEARFSTHPISPAQRDEAHGALALARDDLAATRDEPAIAAPAGPVDPALAP